MPNVDPVLRPMLAWYELLAVGNLAWTSPGFWLPLSAAIVFALAALLTKRTSKWAIDIWRISFVCNLVTAIAFQAFWFGIEEMPPWQLLWQPAVVAGLFIVGQVFTLVSLSHGEISVAAPVLGLKIIFVPIFLSLVTAVELPGSLWIACAGATLAVVLLNYTDAKGGKSRVGFSIVCAGTGAAAFALFDVCVQLWASGWQGGGFLPTVFLLSTAISFGFIPLFHEPLRSLPQAAWPTLLGASFFFAGQSLGIVCAVAFWGQAAAANVVYSSRGLWSLALVWLVGRYMGASDTSLTPRALAFRMGGALVLLLSIILLIRG